MGGAANVNVLEPKKGAALCYGVEVSYGYQTG